MNAIALARMLINRIEGETKDSVGVDADKKCIPKMSAGCGNADRWVERVKICRSLYCQTAAARIGEEKNICVRKYVAHLWCKTYMVFLMDEVVADLVVGVYVTKT